MEQPVNGKTYYGYLYEDNKKPTKLFNALLRGIANYIIEHVGDKETRCLSPPKLAAFYKAVGGNYDPLFVDVPNPNISYIYQSIGCQHSLQPTSNDFEAPSIPALTPEGFARWESIETLLGPAEHVPFLQNAIRDFTIVHPETGERFPTDLPKESFPLEPDPDIMRWHKVCAEKLKDQATTDKSDRPNARPYLPPRPDVRSGYSHLKRPFSPGRSPRERQQGADYFSARPIRYQHIPAGEPSKPTSSRGSSYRPYLSPADDVHSSPRLRRRSFPENYYSASPVTTPRPGSPQPVHVQPVNKDHTRRHSHPRHRHQTSTSSSSSCNSSTDAESSEEGTSPPVSPERKRKPYKQPPTPNIRFAAPVPASPTKASYANSPQRHHTTTAAHGRERLAPYKIPIGHSPSAKVPLPSVRVSRQNTSADIHTRGGGELRGTVRGDDVRRRSLNMSATVEDYNGDDYLDDPWTRNREREREREREKRIGSGARLVQARSGSHDGRYSVRDGGRERERDRERVGERYSDRDEKDRRGRRRPVSPGPAAKGMDWKRYIPEILR